MFSTPCSCSCLPLPVWFVCQNHFLQIALSCFWCKYLPYKLQSKLHQKDYGHILRVSLPCPPSAGIAKSLLNIVAFNLFFDFSCNKWLEGTTNTTLQPNCAKMLCYISMYHTWTTRDELLTDCFSVPLIHCTQKVHFLEWVLVCNDCM